MKIFPDSTDMLLIITSTGDELFRKFNIDDLEWPRTLKIEGVSEFLLQFQAAKCILRVNCAKWLEIDQDNLRTTFSPLNIDFSSPSSDPYVQKSRQIQVSKRGTPHKSYYFSAIVLSIAQVWKTGKVPSEWREGIIVSLYKGKGPRTSCGSYHPISLLSVPGKVFAHVILNRLQPLLTACLLYTSPSPRD